MVWCAVTGVGVGVVGAGGPWWAGQGGRDGQGLELWRGGRRGGVDLLVVSCLSRLFSVGFVRVIVLCLCQ